MGEKSEEKESKGRERRNVGNEMREICEREILAASGDFAVHKNCFRKS